MLPALVAAAIFVRGSGIHAWGLDRKSGYWAGGGFNFHTVTRWIGCEVWVEDTVPRCQMAGQRICECGCDSAIADVSGGSMTHRHQ
jgi:hypothetical protein